MPGYWIAPIAYATKKKPIVANKGRNLRSILNDRVMIEPLSSQRAR